MAKKQTYYCVLAKGYDWRKMEVLLLSKNEPTAKRIYQKWNDDIKLTKEHMEKYNLVVETLEL
jgi:hypothetical protein